MKLIDLLVQELPKRGGWPDCAVCATQDKDGEVCFSEGETPEFGLMAWHDGDWCGNEFHTITATDYDTAIITRAQYESALAASQKPAWNGEGLPPVWCECECHVDEGVIHFIVVGYDFEGKAVVMRNVPARKYFSIQADSGRIKPLRTEAERKRDEAIEEMFKIATMHTTKSLGLDLALNSIYSAIAAGKIPGVKLED